MEKLSPRLLLTFGLMLFFLSCKEKAKQTNVPLADTSVEWTKDYHDFGTIDEGETVAHTFYFKNTGQQNFVIKKIDSGCGCTTVNYDKTPVKEGKEGKIEVIFNSSGRYGKQYKEIRIFANVPKKETVLKFTANVIPK